MRAATVRRVRLKRQLIEAGSIHDAASAKLLDALIGYVSTCFHQQRGASTKMHNSMPLVKLQEGWHRTNKHQEGRTRLGGHEPRRWSSPAFGHAHAKRSFHNYFVTHLPSSSLHPDSRSSSGPHHKLPRDASTPHTPRPGSSPAAAPPNMPSRDLTVVRIPLQSAKHHYGSFNSRGSRPYNEDTHQAGTIDMPAFAKRGPISLVHSQLSKASGEATAADSAFGDPQVFYFGVFDGHGGSECSEFLRNELHGYIEETADEFGLKSSLRHDKTKDKKRATQEMAEAETPDEALAKAKNEALDKLDMKGEEDVEDELRVPDPNAAGASGEVQRMDRTEGVDPVPAKSADPAKAVQLQRELLREYRSTIGGYFRRICPEHFDEAACSTAPSKPASTGPDQGTAPDRNQSPPSAVTVESVVEYAFLRADLDFVTAQARKPDPDDPYADDFPLNQDEILGKPHHSPPSGHRIGGPTRFRGGSTASVALISTPTPAPFWHPAASSTLVVAHVGDTRVLLCETATGLPVPLTADHHPSAPSEARRLQRGNSSGSGSASSSSSPPLLITDSFGEERTAAGLANSRAFGDVASKRGGVSAEPELARVDLGPAQYSFMVLMSDGVSGGVSDQEVVDVVKEARTPAQAAQAVVEYATELAAGEDGDNATCIVVRLGGWERRSEGGVGSLGTKEIRDMRKAEALDPRRGRW